VDQIGQTILWITLIALFLIPLLFNYFGVVAVHDELRTYLLHFAAGSLVVLWLWRVIIIRVQDVTRSQRNTIVDPLGWIGSNAARWALVAVGVLVLVQVVSTLLSPLPMVSLFGDIETLSGHNLYDTVSLTVLLISVAFNMRTERNIVLLGYVIVGSGTIAAVYGIAQHFGWDPIGGQQDRDRIISSFSNTLNFSAYLVMSIPATMAIWHSLSKRSTLWISVITLALAFQFSALFFTGGRAALVATAIGAVAYFLISFLLIPRRDVLRITLATLAAGAIAVIFVVLPSGRAIDNGRLSSLDRIQSLGEQELTGISDSQERQQISSGLYDRLLIWRSVLELTSTWQVPAEESTVNSVLRPVFGLGPEMLVYSFPFVDDPRTGIIKVDHAHNYPLNVLVETGYLGFITLVALVVLLIVSAVKTVKTARTRSRKLNMSAIAILLVFPALVGRFVELQSGVPRVSDITMMFALIGAVIAIHEFMRKSVERDEPERESRAEKTSTSFSISGNVFLNSAIVIAVVTSILFMTVFIGWDMRRLSASRHLAVHLDDPVAAFNNNIWQEAQSRAPERSAFTINLYKLYADAAQNQKEKGNDERAVQLILAGRELLLAYEKYNPLRLDTQIGLAQASLRMSEWGYPEYSQESLDRYVRIANTYPNFPTLIGTAATVMSSLGDHEMAIELADRAIAAETVTEPWSKAWYAKGRSLYLLGHEQEAIEVLQIAITKDPESEGAVRSKQMLDQIDE